MNIKSVANDPMQNICVFVMKVQSSRVSVHTFQAVKFMFNDVNGKHTRNNVFIRGPTDTFDILEDGLKINKIRFSS